MIAKYWIYITVFMATASGYGVGRYAPDGNEIQLLEARQLNNELQIQIQELKLKCLQTMKRVPLKHSRGEEF